MTIRHTLLTLATGIALLTSPVMAGGPVIVAEEPFIQEARPSSEGRWVVPVIVGALILCAIACGGDKDDTPAAPPPPPCKGGC